MTSKYGKWIAKLENLTSLATSGVASPGQLVSPGATAGPQTAPLRGKVTAGFAASQRQLQRGAKRVPSFASRRRGK